MSGYIAITTVSDEIEAISLQEYLKEAGIYSMVRRFSIPVADPGFFGSGPLGIGASLEGLYGELLVPEELAEKARQIIEDLRKIRENGGD
jgi:hypothetical protein